MGVGLTLPLEDQIRQRWGQYGNWQHADQDLVAQLAGLFRENGISDISNLQFKPRMANHRIVEQGESGPINEYDVQRQVYDAFLGDQQIGYLGDVNRDGSYTRGGLEASTLGGMADMGRMGIDGSTLAWSAGVEGKDGAKGHLNFQIVPGPDGDGVVVPVWESSAAGDLENARMAATMAAMAAGGYYLGPEAAAGGTAAEGGVATTAAGGVNWGAVGTSAAKGAGSNMLLTAARGGNMNAILRSGLTGAVSGGMGGVGAGLGWDPTLTSAGTSAGLTLANGGTTGDALRSGLASGLSTYGSTAGITGNQAVDRAITGAGAAAIRGGDARSVVMGGLNGLASGTQRGGNNYGAGDIDDALSEDNIVRFDDQQEGGNAMDDYGGLDWDGGNIFTDFDPRADENGYGDFDPRADENGYGGGTTLGTTPVLEGEFDGLDPRGENYGHEGDNYPTPESTQGSGGSPVNAAMAQTWVDDLVKGGMKLGDAWKAINDFLGSPVGKSLFTTGLAAGLSKKAAPADNDPMLKKADDGTTTLATTAGARANTDDAYFRSTFLPQYLGLMQQQVSDGRRITDFNLRRMGLAARQMDKLYEAADAYDSDAAIADAVGKAGASVEQQNSAAMQSLVRNFDRRGINPNSGLVMTNMRENAQAGALQKALAMTMARNAAKREGLNLRMGVAGLRGADATYADGALRSAGLGMSGVQGAQGGFNSNTQATNQTMGLAGNLWGNLGSWGTTRTNSADQINVANAGGWNQLVGYAAGNSLNQPRRP